MWYNATCSAGVAHPVERHLAKVEVASSSLVTRSIKDGCESNRLFLVCQKLVFDRLTEVNRDAKTSKPDSSAYRWYGRVRFAK